MREQVRGHADHVGGEAHALVLMLVERIQEILPGRGIVGSRVFGRQAQKELGFHDGLNHGGLLKVDTFGSGHDTATCRINVCT